jgi:hypothetical protein
MHRRHLICLLVLSGLVAALPLPARVRAASLPLIRMGGSGDPGSMDENLVSPRISVLSSRAGGLTLEFELPALSIEDVTIDGRTFQEVAIPRGGLTGDIGSPQMPTFARLIEIPDRAGVEVQAVIEEEEEIDGIRLVPVQPDEGGPLVINDAAYARNDFGTTPAARTGPPVILRDLRTVALSLRPVRYNPDRDVIKVARRIRIDVTFAGENLENVKSRPPRPIATSFDTLYRHLVANYSGPPAGVEVTSGTLVFICPDSPDVLTLIQPLIDWKKRMGWPVVMATTTETGTTRAAIKAWIQNAYDTWPVPPEYICIVADAAGNYSIPTGSGEGDHAYVQLDGTDVLADAHIGRLSISTAAELEAIVNKVVGYESNPWSQDDPDWFTRACLVGDPGASGRSTVMVQQCIKDRLRDIGYTQIDTIFGGSFVPQMTTALNRGDTIFSYRGYLGMSGWTNANSSALTNGSKMPFCVTITCGTGSWASGTSLTEGFLRAGTVGNPKGGIGAIGTATTGTHTRYNNCIHYGIFWGLLYEDQTTMGAALTRGKIEMYLNYYQDEPSTVLTWCTWNNLMGDPSCDVYLAHPGDLAVQHPASIPLGANSIVVTVADGGNPVSGALVCALKGTESRSVGSTDAAGRVEIPLTIATAGELKLTVTKHNKRAYLATVPVAAENQYIGYSASIIDDDSVGESAGNGDGRINPLETIELPVQIRNFGTEEISGLTATLTTGDPYVTITDAFESFGDLPAGASAWSADDFDFVVDPGCPDGHVLRFGLEIQSGSTTWHSLIDLTAVSADLASTTTTLYNAGTNGILDPGETVGLSVRLVNNGGMAATGVIGTLIPESGFVGVSDPTGAFGTIAPGGTGEDTADHFTITASPTAYPGSLAILRLVTVFSGGVRDTATVALTVGQRLQEDPIGPDHYGYYAFDDTDTRYPDAPHYSWIELDPNYGGIGGKAVPLTDFSTYQDDTEPVDLPFTFQYYGQTYDKVSICSNGWVALGWNWLVNYRNWTIPGAGGPNGMLCGFWDDLRIVTGSGVYTRFDRAAHRFIIEYSRVQNEVGGQQVFEIILYDPAFQATATGDGAIVMQYHTVNNNDSGDNYATVGIESPDGFDGLLYTYYRHYPTGAAPLASGRAIRYVPASDLSGAIDAPGAARARFALLPAQPNPMQGATTFSFSLDRADTAHLNVYDVQGRLVRSLIEGARPAGFQTIVWDGRDRKGAVAPAGIYFYRLSTSERGEVRKLVRVE